MNKFGNSSNKKLETCHPKIQELLRKVVQKHDCTVLEGVRTLKRQQMLFTSGRSKTMNSKHLERNGVSYAVDVVPYPISWGDKEQKEMLEAFKSRDSELLKEKFMQYRHVIARFYFFAGVVNATADEMGIKIRWGGDWNGNGDFSDQTFHDLPHFEYVE